MTTKRAKRRVTLTDVAALAGVSSTTASYILNGRSNQMRISADAQCRVNEAVATLGYRPNRSARSLRTATTKTIGVLSDWVASGHYANHMLTGASAAARRLDHLLVIAESEGEPDVEALLINEMLERQVDGILYATLVTSEITLPAALAGTRVVLLNCFDPQAPVPAVLPDEYAGGRSAAEAVLAAGIRSGIHLVGEDPTPEAIAGPMRRAGVRDRLAEEGLELDEPIGCDWSVAGGYTALHAWLAQGNRPSALICLNDRIAMGAYQALGGCGLGVPEDVSVVSFDGSELAGWLRPALTSVALPFAELGALAVQTLMSTDAPPKGVLRVPMNLLEGGSLAVHAR